MNDNLRIYNQVREVPSDAKKPIQGGRLKGKTDINPMWRLKVLTELFGPCGIGWKYEIVDKRLEPAGNGEVAAFVDINLYIKVDETWSDPIPGTGGNMFVINERNGVYVSDECFKMALTDAISVSCKALGVGADIYWGTDTTKYDTYQSQSQSKQDKPQQKPHAKSTNKTTNQVTKPADCPEVNQDINRVQIMNIVLGVARDKGINIGEINKGVAKYFPGKDNIAQLDEVELHQLLDKLNASEVG